MKLATPPLLVQLARVARQMVSVRLVLAGIVRATLLPWMALEMVTEPTPLVPSTSLPTVPLAPRVPSVSPLLPWIATSPVKVGLDVMSSAPQVPPAPRVMTVPPPVRLPVPLEQVKVTLPCTAVLAVLP